MKKWLLFTSILISALCQTLLSAATVPLYSFEDGTTQGWRINNDSWAQGFSSMEVSTTGATDGTKSLQIQFEGQSYKWGGIRSAISDAGILDAMKSGGKLLLDLSIPTESAGIQHLGFTLQQPDVTGDANWQQVWFNVAGRTGKFSVELPFTRKGTGPVNLHLGQNASLGANYTVFIDNIRLEQAASSSGNTNVVIFKSFEDGTSQGWRLNTADWARGFKNLAVSSTNATHGTNSLKIDFDGLNYKWGAVLENYSDPAFLGAIRYGGKLLVDMFVPEESAGIQNIGFSLQQPDVQGALNWQQIWFGVAGGTGKFTLELPFTRDGSQAVNLHLGQNSTPDGNYTVYLDNFRVIGNPPPPAGVTITNTFKLFSFETGTEGFDINSAGWAGPFTSVEAVNQHPTDGTNSLKVEFEGADFKWGAQALNIRDVNTLSALSEGGKILVDAFIPTNSTGIKHLGVVLQQPDVQGDQNWQQVWYWIGNATGRFTIDLPFKRLGSGVVNFHLGRNSDAGTTSTVFFDNFRVQSLDTNTGVLATINITPNPNRTARIDFTGQLQSSTNVTGPYANVSPTPSSPLTINLTEAKRFYRSVGESGILFLDNFEGGQGGWTVKKLPGDAGGSTWQVGTPALEDLTNGFSGSKVFSTSLSGNYANNSAISLLSPAINLSGIAGARLSFYQILQAGGVTGDTDKAAVYIRDANGGVITGLENPIFQASQASTILYWARQKIELPPAALGKIIRLEFQFQSDANSNDQAGWFIDDVRLVRTK